MRISSGFVGHVVREQREKGQSLLVTEGPQHPMRRLRVRL